MNDGVTDLASARKARTNILGRVERGQGKAGVAYTLDERLTPKDTLALVQALSKLETLIQGWSKD